MKKGNPRKNVRHPRLHVQNLPFKYEKSKCFSQSSLLIMGMNVDTKIIEQLEAAFNEEFKLVENNLMALEHLVREKMQLLDQGLLQRIVSRKKTVTWAV